MTRSEILQVAKPIQFNTHMVRAILDGRKTVTRRAIKPQPKMRLCYVFAGYGAKKWHYPDKNAWEYWGKEFERPDTMVPEDEEKTWTPPCHTDDILYVRETWCKEFGKYYFRADFGSDYLDACETLSGGYPAECRYYPGCKGCMKTGSKIKWRPSIHMPKEAARLFLLVTDVRVERLQDITEEQAIKEGFDGEPCTCVNAGQYGCTDCMGTGWIEPPKVDFMYTWNSTIKKSDLSRYGWAANPWCWVIEFERVEV